MIGLAVTINNFFIWLLAIFVMLPITLMVWFMLGFILSMFIGPLGIPIAFMGMIYYARH